jgi:hypothetical protein
MISLMPFDCSAVSSTPKFRSEFRDVTNNEWHTTDDVTLCNTCRRHHRSDIAPRSCIVMIIFSLLSCRCLRKLMVPRLPQLTHWLSTMTTRKKCVRGHLR